MTRISFYEIAGGADAQFGLCCQLAAKAMAQGLDTLIHCPDTDAIEQLDVLLWSHLPTAFIPHGRAPDPATPVTLNQGGDPGHHHGLLINLAAGAPDWFSRFERLAEFVHAENPLQREQMRDRYRFYRDRGYAIEHHKLGAPARALAS